jgi:hypothetical protein
MSPKDAESGAQAILLKRVGQSQFYVLVDNPNDCRATITAFRKLGCKVRVELDGARLRVMRQV